MNNQTNSGPKTGRKLDAFERFHNRPKRRALGDISNQKNRALQSRGIKKSVLTNQNNGSRAENKAQRAQKITLKSPNLVLDEGSSLYKGSDKKNWGKNWGNHLSPFSFFDTKKSKSESCLPAVRQLSHVFRSLDGLKKSDENSELNYIDSQKLEMVEKDLEVFDVRKSVLYAGPTNYNPNPRFIPKMIPYNSVVERSNGLIRTFCDEAKLGTWKRASEVGHVTHIIVKVSNLSPLLSAVTTDSGQEILLANTEKVQLEVGARLILGSYAGTHPKMYTSWRLL